MFAMFKKVNINENWVGWYSSGPTLRVNDLKINDLFRKYMTDPVFLVVDVPNIDKRTNPTEAYRVIE